MNSKKMPVKWIAILAILILTLELFVVNPVKANQGSYRRSSASEKQARQLATFKPNRPAGSAFEYSNTNYNLLDLIIEAASGETYADYVQNYIFAPLDMTHTYTSKAAAKQENMSTGYISWSGFPMPVPDLPYPSGSLSAGQLRCRYFERGKLTNENV